MLFSWSSFFSIQFPLILYWWWHSPFTDKFIKYTQTETEIVLQSPARIVGLIVVLLLLVLGQLFFVFKKKQFERIQLASGLYD